MPPQQYRPALTPREVQAALGLGCVETVHRLIKRGELRAVRMGKSDRGRYRIRPEDLEAYLAGRKADDALDAYVDAVVAQAKNLTDEQYSKLADLLKPVRQRPRATR
ncbi:helix-turn-helix domain-containing protein [Mycobacterium avium]|uniref:helix-turn-helix domain-containing protein n=1 Tax=Mycobacterium avium TaxID=1764 RepID=UPI001CC5C96D|nr:helix-turn-helix domain-containing protein [Mycobacterium avium subsp. hominissuis]